MSSEEQLRKMQKRLVTIEAKLSFLKDTTHGLWQEFNGFQNEFDEFTELYIGDIKQINRRLEKLEEQAGFNS